MTGTYYDKESNPLPDGWVWEENGERWYAANDLALVWGRIGRQGIEIMVQHRGGTVVADLRYLPWKVLLAVKNRAIAEARSVEEELRARADDLRPEDRFVNGDRVRYVGNPEHHEEMRKIMGDRWEDKNVGATGTVTGFSTPKHGYEHVKWQSVLVTWDEESARPGITIEGRETMVDSVELEALEVH